MLASPAAATDACDDLWFTRNLIFDRAGYCFGSTLGQSVFDNGDCTTGEPSLSPELKETVDRIRARETWFDCQVNTSATSLNLDAMELRKSLDTLPVIDEFESACLGWQGEPMSLFAGISPDARQIGSINPGDDVFFSHELQGDASFVTVSQAGQFRALGWGVFPQDEELCGLWAG